jgi:hypothetical protein
MTSARRSEAAPAARSALGPVQAGPEQEGHGAVRAAPRRRGAPAGVLRAPQGFSRCLHISLSSDKLFDVFDEAKVDALKRDWKQFSELKRSVQLRYQETVDVREFEPKIQKLLDDHVVAMPAETIIEVVNINDPDALKAVVEETGVSEASRADRIASATRRAITEKMDEDPTFYRSSPSCSKRPSAPIARSGCPSAST